LEADKIHNLPKEIEHQQQPQQQQKQQKHSDKEPILNVGGAALEALVGPINGSGKRPAFRQIFLLQFIAVLQEIVYKYSRQ